MSGDAKKVNNRGVFGWLFRIFAGYEMAIAMMGLLLILTWFCTLEQVDRGIYWTLERYFSFDAFYVRPILNEKPLPLILPGGYWVCVVFTINLILGGLIRARKGWKQIFLLVSHFSMVFLMVSGAVGYHQSKEAMMLLEVGERADYAKNGYEEAIEVFEVVNGKRTAPTVINSERLSALRADPERRREFILPEFPFNLEVTGYQTSAQLAKAPPAGAGSPVVDGMVMQLTKPDLSEELNLSACYVKVTEKESGDKHFLILAEKSNNYSTFTVDGKVYGIQLVQEIWPMPYTVELVASKGEYYPNTRRAKTYESDIRVIESEGDEGQDFHIEMNKPLRYQDLTTYQTRWDNQNGRIFSGFMVKTNPSDQWPKIAIYVCGAALGCHFLFKLSLFIAASVGGGKRAKK